MMTIRRAVPGDLRTVLSVLHSVQGWLHREGYDQWPAGSRSLSPPSIEGQIMRGEFWILSEDRDPVAVIALSRIGDPDFWTVDELTEPAIYISKAAVLRRAAGRGLGALLLRWAVDHAAGMGAKAARLDVWKTNAGLQAYYRRQGWHYLRTEETLGRNSGALFCKPAARDQEAHDAFRLTGGPTVDAAPIHAGMRVIVPTDDGPVSAECTRVSSDCSHGETSAGWEQGTFAPPVYFVERDGASWVARDAWQDPAPVIFAAPEVVMF